MKRDDERRLRILAYLGIAEAIREDAYKHTGAVGRIMLEQAEIYEERVARIRRFNRVRRRNDEATV